MYGVSLFGWGRLWCAPRALISAPVRGLDWEAGWLGRRTWAGLICSLLSPATCYCFIHFAGLFLLWLGRLCTTCFMGNSFCTSIHVPIALVLCATLPLPLPLLEYQAPTHQATSTYAPGYAGYGRSQTNRFVSIYILIRPYLDVIFFRFRYCSIFVCLWQILLTRVKKY